MLCVIERSLNSIVRNHFQCATTAQGGHDIMNDETHRIRVKKGQVEIEVEGSRQFVESRFDQLWNDLIQTVVLPPTEVPPGLGEITDVAKGLEGLSLGEFYKSKSPKNNPETMLVFYYWLKHKEQKPNAPLKDIGECYRKISLREDTNRSKTARGLSSGRKAYLKKGKKRGEYALTLSGEEFVEKELPQKGKVS